MTSAEVCERSGVTYRMLDHYVRTGLIPGVASLTDKGSGNPREWTPQQVEFVVILAQLVRAGIGPRVASEALSPHVDGLAGLSAVTLPGGLVVSVRPRLSAVTA